MDDVWYEATAKQWLEGTTYEFEWGDDLIREAINLAEPPCAWRAHQQGMSGVASIEREGRGVALVDLDEASDVEAIGAREGLRLARVEGFAAPTSSLGSTGECGGGEGGGGDGSLVVFGDGGLPHANAHDGAPSGGSGGGEGASSALLAVSDRGGTGYEDVLLLTLEEAEKVRAVEQQEVAERSKREQQERREAAKAAAAAAAAKEKAEAADKAAAEAEARAAVRRAAREANPHWAAVKKAADELDKEVGEAGEDAAPFPYSPPLPHSPSPSTAPMDCAVAYSITLCRVLNSGEDARSKAKQARATANVKKTFHEKAVERRADALKAFKAALRSTAAVRKRVTESEQSYQVGAAGRCWSLKVAAGR